MTGRFADLDALLGEIDERPVEIRLYGKVWQLPASVPADLMLRLERTYAFISERVAAGDMDAEVPDIDDLDVFATADTMCGEHNVKDWRGRGISREHLWTVIWRVMTIHNGYTEDAPADGDGDAKPPAPRAGRSTKSSNGGGRSKRTSSGSTGSTSRARSGT